MLYIKLWVEKLVIPLSWFLQLRKKSQAIWKCSKNNLENHIKPPFKKMKKGTSPEVREKMTIKKIYLDICDYV